MDSGNVGLHRIAQESDLEQFVGNRVAISSQDTSAEGFALYEGIHRGSRVFLSRSTLDPSQGRYMVIRYFAPEVGSLVIDDTGSINFDKSEPRLTEFVFENRDPYTFSVFSRRFDAVGRTPLA
ncbi:MAG: hypothetical protein AABX53_00565 [Nanoarchaeota archaeon]